MRGRFYLPLRDIYKALLTLSPRVPDAADARCCRSAGRFTMFSVAQTAQIMRKSCAGAAQHAIRDAAMPDRARRQHIRKRKRGGDGGAHALIKQQQSRVPCAARHVTTPQARAVLLLCAILLFFTLARYCYAMLMLRAQTPRDFAPAALLRRCHVDSTRDDARVVFVMQITRCCLRPPPDTDVATTPRLSAIRHAICSATRPLDAAADIFSLFATPSAASFTSHVRPLLSRAIITYAICSCFLLIRDMPPFLRHRRHATIACHATPERYFRLLIFRYFAFRLLLIAYVAPPMPTPKIGARQTRRRGADAASRQDAPMLFSLPKISRLPAPPDAAPVPFFCYRPARPSARLIRVHAFAGKSFCRLRTFIFR